MKELKELKKRIELQLKESTDNLDRKVSISKLQLQLENA
jgi:hypothetical protein